MEIYLNRDGQQMGSFTMEQIQQQLASGNVLPTDLAWHEGLPEWVPVQQLAAAAPAKKESWFTLKRVVIGTVIWFVLMMVISLGVFLSNFSGLKKYSRTQCARGEVGYGHGRAHGDGLGRAVVAVGGASGQTPPRGQGTGEIALIKSIVRPVVSIL